MKALESWILAMADDALILGHRNSEWTGLGPILEEDIAFSSMAQDKIGHAHALYEILHQEFGYPDPDTTAFNRTPEQFRCAQLVELPFEGYEYALARHFYFEHAHVLFQQCMEKSGLNPLQQLAKKMNGELKYHQMHADIWIKKLVPATEESRIRMTQALRFYYPFALGLFEPTEDYPELILHGWPAMDLLKSQWENNIRQILPEASSILDPISETPHLGGRIGQHTEFLPTLLNEMTEVYRIDPEAEW